MNASFAYIVRKHFGLMKTLTKVGFILLFLTLGSMAQAQFIYDQGSSWSIWDHQIANYQSESALFNPTTPTISAQTHLFAAPVEVIPQSMDMPPKGTAVPEPSTYGILGALLLMGIVILRRRHL